MRLDYYAAAKFISHYRRASLPTINHPRKVIYLKHKHANYAESVLKYLVYIKISLTKAAQVKLSSAEGPYLTQTSFS